MKNITYAILTVVLLACNAPKRFTSIDEASQQKVGDQNCQSTPLQVQIPSSINTGLSFQLSVNHPQAHWRITYKGVSTTYDGGTISLNLTEVGSYSGLVTSVDECGISDTLEFSFHVNAGVQSPMLQINNGAAYTKALQVNLTLSALNADQMLITNNSDCNSDGVWETYSTAKAWNLKQKNQNNIVYAKFKNANSQSSCVQAQIIDDELAPNLTWLKTPPVLTTETSAHFEWSAMDSGSGVVQQSCELDGVTTNSCSGKEDFTGLSTGNHNFSVVTTDKAGNSAKIFYQWQIGLALGSSSITINGGSAFTKQLSVQLTLNSPNATEMYITNTPDCGNGGTWEPYSTQRAWNLLSENQLNMVYAKFKNAVSSSECVSAQITHDNVGPVILFTKKPSPLTGDSEAQLSWTINENLSGLKTQLCSLDNQALTVCNLSLFYNNLALGVHNFNVVAYDFAGNQSQASYSWTISPVVSSPGLLINAGAAYTNNQQVTLSLFAKNANQMFITNNSDCLNGGTWETFSSQKNWSLSGLNQQDTVYAKFKNTVGESLCISAQIIHDNIAPTVSLTLKPAISTMDVDAQFAWNVLDNLSGLALVQCQLDSGALANCQSSISYSKLALGIHSFNILATDKAGNSSQLNYSWTITPPPSPVLSEGVCKGGESLTSCLKCDVPLPPVIPPWSPKTKAEKLAEIQRLSCPIANKSDFMYNNYDASRPPTREQIFSKIQACTTELYPESALSAASLNTINALLNANDVSMRKKIYGGLWYQPPYTDHFELYFGLSSLEARQIFCYGQDLGSVLQGDLITSEYSAACSESETKCSAWKSDKKAQARWNEVQKYRQQLRDCIGKSNQMPPLEPPQPWVQPVCNYKQFNGYFEVGGQAYLESLLADGYKVSVESNNACVNLSASQSFVGIVHIGAYKCQ